VNHAFDEFAPENRYLNFEVQLSFVFALIIDIMQSEVKNGKGTKKRLLQINK
jgi:hypothetical protein